MHRVVILLVALVCSAAAVAAQSVVTPGRYQIEIVATGKVLDLRSEDKKSVQQWANGGGRNQQWEIEDAGGGYVYIRSLEAAKVLDMAESRARDGAALIVADKRDSDNQKWKIADGGNGQFTIVSKSGKSIESPAGKREDGVRLQVWGPHGLENQRFKLTRLGELESRVRPRDGSTGTPVTPGVPPVAPITGSTGFIGKARYQIQSVASGHYLDLRREDNQTLQQWSGSGAKNQQWDAEDAGGGYFFLRNVENGRYVEATNSRDGSAVLLRDRTGRDNQKWRVVDAGKGEAIILSRNGKALDLPNSETREGAAMQLWGEHRRDNQRFRLALVETTETYSGGRTRGGQGGAPVRDIPPVQEPYSSGRMTWRGRVDIEILLEVRGNAVTEKNVGGQSFNNGRASFSAPMPAREMDVRIQNKKVRGSVTLVEKPSPANNFTAIIRISDPSKDAADYEFELIW